MTIVDIIIWRIFLGILSSEPNFSYKPGIHMTGDVRCSTRPNEGGTAAAAAAAAAAARWACADDYTIMVVVVVVRHPANRGMEEPEATVRRLYALSPNLQPFFYPSERLFRSFSTTKTRTARASLTNSSPLLPSSLVIPPARRPPGGMHNVAYSVPLLSTCRSIMKREPRTDAAQVGSSKDAYQMG